MAKTEKGGKEGKSAATEVSESPIEEATPRSVAKADAVRSTSDILDQIFLADDLIPDPAATFSTAVPSVEEAVKTANIVLDTNVLLLPYGAGSSSLIEIIKALKVLADKKRLFLPGQVVREFIRNRPKKLGELQQQLQDKISKFAAIDKFNFPILEGDSEYKNLNELLAKTVALKKELNDASASVVKKNQIMGMERSSK